MIMKTKTASQRSTVVKLKNGVKEKVTVETEKMKRTDKPLMPICCKE